MPPGGGYVTALTRLTGETLPIPPIHLHQSATFQFFLMRGLTLPCEQRRSSNPSDVTT